MIKVPKYCKDCECETWCEAEHIDYKSLGCYLNFIDEKAAELWYEKKADGKIVDEILNELGIEHERYKGD